jgi:glycolate oxidase FAD binding subunit
MEARFRLPTSTASKAADQGDALAERVREASKRGEALTIVGGGTKAFYGRRTGGAPLALGGHSGVIDYEPSELVITARAGTTVTELEALLAQQGQMLAFEPPILGPSGTLGGLVATGLSGPRRPFVGAVRDFVLGVTVLDGRGRRLRLGGTVFKNVAGFDGFRLMAGALGCLGILLDVSLRVVPRPPVERALTLEGDWPWARRRITDLMRRPLPLSGAFHDGLRLRLRLSGARTAVDQAAREIGGEEASPTVFDDIRHMRSGLLIAPRLWRLSVPRGAQIDGIAGAWLMDWAGGQRWLVTSESAVRVRDAVVAAGGHATLFRGAEPGEDVFTPLSAPLLALHKRLKSAFDPAGVLNAGRMYEDL